VSPFEFGRRWAFVALVVAVGTFVQAFTALKLAPLALFVGCAIADAAWAQRPTYRPALLLFYLALAALGMVWALIGLLEPGNYREGATDAIRLYVLWSLAFLTVYALLRARPSLAAVHRGLVLAGLAIAAVNLTAVLDLLLGLGLVPESVRQPMELYVGVKDGYLQINSNNIGALFVVVPYLATLHIRRDGRPDRWATLALVVAGAVALLSGRRALWLALALLPPLWLVLGACSGQGRLVRARRALLAYSVAVAFGAGVLLTLPDTVSTGSPQLDHVRDAFGAEDERSRQAPFLLARFADAPVLGTGFGAFAGYARSDDRPWNYELTYHKLLMNLGLVGTALLVAIMAGTTATVCTRLRRYRAGSGVPFALLVAVCALCIGAYSNPYFGSFDYLFFVGLLPYLASFRHGWESSLPTGQLVHGRDRRGAAESLVDVLDDFLPDFFDDDRAQEGEGLAEELAEHDETSVRG
jgi:hypothetical protein